MELDERRASGRNYAATTGKRELWTDRDRSIAFSTYVNKPADKGERKRESERREKKGQVERAGRSILLEGCRGTANMYHKLAFKGIARRPGWDLAQRAHFCGLKGPLCTLHCCQSRFKYPIYIYIWTWPRMTTNHPSSHGKKGWSLSWLVMREKKKKKGENGGWRWRLNRSVFIPSLQFIEFGSNSSGHLRPS